MCMIERNVESELAKIANPDSRNNGIKTVVAVVVVENNLLQRKCQNQLTHPSLSHIDAECLGEFDSKKDSIQQKFLQRMKVCNICKAKF